MITVLFDVDGVLANFMDGLDREMRMFPDAPYVPYQFGHPVWEKIKNTPGWWTTLPALISPEQFARIREISLHAEVVFGTNRFSNVDPAGLQTSEWLERHGLPSPNVVLTKKKGELAALIGAHFAIDDKPENAACIYWIAEKTETFLLTNEYTFQGDTSFVPKGVKRINQLDPFLTAVEEWL